MKVQKIKLNSYDYSWLVLDDNFLPIKPITDFIRYLNNTDKSPHTVRSYAYHLKVYWEYLDEKNLDWKSVNIASLSGLVGWLREYNQNNKVIHFSNNTANRTNSTINTVDPWQEFWTLI